jgi:hypothetical protein
MCIRIYTNVHRNTTDHAHHAIMRRSLGLWSIFLLFGLDLFFV